jgi:hypothetical protein
VAELPVKVTVAEVLVTALADRWWSADADHRGRIHGEEGGRGGGMPPPGVGLVTVTL